MKCKKVKFRDELAAMLALSKAYSRGRDECRYYRCPQCKSFHLTSQPLKEKRET